LVIDCPVVITDENLAFFPAMKALHQEVKICASKEEGRASSSCKTWQSRLRCRSNLRLYHTSEAKVFIALAYNISLLRTSLPQTRNDIY